MEPISAVATVWGIAKAAGEVSKKLYDLGKSVKDRDIKQQIDEILDDVRELKQTASNVEDENRELREKLRFKSDDFEFRSPFWHEKTHPDRALCPRCFAKNIAAPMGEMPPGGSGRCCLVCTDFIRTEFGGHEILSSGSVGPFSY